MTRFLLATLALAGLAACQPGEPVATKTTVDTDGTRNVITATGAWCRPTPNGARTGACYLTLRSSAGDRLTGVATPVSTATQIHTMTMENDVMRMSELAEGLPLPAEQAVTLAPGGEHLMLVGLTAPLVAGQTVALSLGFEKSPAMTVQAEVRQPEPAAPATAPAKKH
jgi:copper(I)-binding protein|tara:strand:+ start:129 stop:632 length:504 start_codon:yes stop_codon:yes gene_type:complete